MRTIAVSYNLQKRIDERILAKGVKLFNGPKADQESIKFCQRLQEIKMKLFCRAQRMPFSKKMDVEKYVKVKAKTIYGCSARKRRSIALSEFDKAETFICQINVETVTNCDICGITIEQPCTSDYSNCLTIPG